MQIIQIFFVFWHILKCFFRGFFISKFSEYFVKTIVGYSFELWKHNCVHACTQSHRVPVMKPHVYIKSRLIELIDQQEKFHRTFSWYQISFTSIFFYTSLNIGFLSLKSNIILILLLFLYTYFFYLFNSPGIMHTSTAIHTQWQGIRNSMYKPITAVPKIK